MFGYISLVGGLLLLSMLCIAVSHAVKTESLERNSAIGIRTKSTLASDRAWDVGHHTARPYLIGTALTGIVGTVISLLAIPFFADGGSLTDPKIMVVPAFSFVLQILVFLWSSKKADSAAKSVAS